MYYRVKTVPKRVRTVERFRAPNPWRNNQDEEWSVEAYLMIPEPRAAQFVAPTDPTSRKTKWLYGSEFYGIRPESDGHYRLLPESLNELWKTKQVANEQLPRLLFEIEPKLKKRDFRRHLGNKVGLGFVVGFPIFVLLLAGLLLYFSAGMGGMVPVEEVPKISNETWLSNPMKEGQFVYGDNAITLDGAVPVPVEIKQPSEVRGSFDGQSYWLGWTRAKHENRLVLLSNYSPNSAFLLYGVTYSPRTIGLPDSLISELKSKIKNLNTDQVLCMYWDNRRASLSSISPGTYLFILALFLITLFPLMLILFFRRRPRKQMKWLLERAASTQPFNR